MPSAYLNYIILDENFEAIGGNYQAMTSNAYQSLEKLDFGSQITIDKAGWVFVYVSNESNSTKPVYFDDLKVTVNESKILSKDDYYPFGAMFSSYSKAGMINQSYKYQSKEMIADLGLNVFDFHARFYDPFLGRTSTHDPHSDGYYNLSPYSWVGNNPIRSIDPDGKDFLDALKSLGTVAKKLVSAETYKEIGKGFAEAGRRASASISSAFKAGDKAVEGNETFTTGNKNDVKDVGVINVSEDADTKTVELSTAKEVKETNVDNLDPEKIQSKGYGIDKPTKTDFGTEFDTDADSTVLRDREGQPVIAPPMENGGFSLSRAKKNVTKEDSIKYNINEYSGYNPPN